MIGRRLRNIRKSRGISQEELAMHLRVNSSAISLYETNKNDPSDKIKVEIARYFDVSLDYLMGLIDDQVPCYDQNRFLLIPEKIGADDKKLLFEFTKFIEHRANISIAH